MRDRIRRGAIAVAIAGAVGAGWALAGGPIGGDDTGSFPSDKNVLKCEDGVAKAGTKFAGAVVKCHTKAADSAVAGKTFDEEACEATATTKYNGTVAKLTNCPSCLDPGAVRDNAETQLDTLANALIYCDSAGAAFGGDDAGFVPANKDNLKCADGAYKNLSKQVAGIVKCHTKQVDSLFKSKSFDEETCESTATSKAVAANGKLTKCAPCLAGALAGLPATAEAMLDSINGMTYCASPSGAFLD